LANPKPPRAWYWKPLGPILRRMLLVNKPFQKNAPTAPMFLEYEENPDFEIQKARLVALVHRIPQELPQNPSLEHPYFGPMTAEEWAWLQTKHLDHHLRQFGI
jgi:hypothetical protein